jgi:glycosyltransferase involved in cell wall biosynthesis
MKIAQIICVYPPYKGGMATSAENFARVLKSAGQEVKTFTIPPPSKGGDRGGFEYSEADIIRLKPFPGFGNGGVLPLLCWRLKDFDLIYLHYPFFGTAEIIWFLKKFVWGKKKKLVIQYHMDVVLPNLFLKILSFPSTLIFNSLFKNADLIIAASFDYIKNSKLKNIYAKYSASAKASADKPDKFVEIPFGVDTEKFYPITSPHPSSPPSRGQALKKGEGGIFTILFVGGLDKAHYFKGVDVLLNALNLLNRNNFDWRLEIVGSGDLEENYKNKARGLGIADKVNFLGGITNEDLPKIYRQADCFVLPSVNKGEAFGIVLLEAMATGLPVIASDLPGVRGVFTSASGLLIKPGNAEDLKNKIEFLMNNPAKRKEMGEAARREAEKKYSQKIIEQKLIKEVERL